jgi:phosphoribosylpyrophosphate synthetase
MILFVSNYLFKTQSQKKDWTEAKESMLFFDVYFNDKDHDKHYLLVDDVINRSYTGACSRALLKIPGARVSIVCMAMAQSYFYYQNTVFKLLLFKKQPYFSALKVDNHKKWAYQLN